MQDYLREQKQSDSSEINGQTVDFISRTAQLFGQYIKFINIHTVEIGEQMIDFLNESLQGPCPENQQTLARNKIIDYIKDFILLFPRESDYLQRGFIEKEEQDEINDLMTSSFQVLISILEGNNEEEGARAMLCNTLSEIKFLKKRLIYSYTTYITEELGMEPTDNPKDVTERIRE